MNETDRKAKNAARLKLIDPTIRKQVAAVLATMEYYGHEPIIHGDVWRSPAKQLELYRRGVSWVRWGFHCAERNSKPASLAADIIDADVGWNATIEFWLTLGYAARAQGLGWGGYWKLTKAERARLDVLGKEVTKGGRDIGSRESVKLGIDVAHVETARVTVAQAKKGKR